MNLFSKAMTTGLFGIAVIASGLYRFLSSEGGSTGLTFGLVMGTLAIIAAGLLWRGKRVAGFGLAGLSIAMVGGWFFFEALIKKGLSIAEHRQLIILVLSVLTAVLLALPTRKSD